MKGSCIWCMLVGFTASAVAAPPQQLLLPHHTIEPADSSFRLPLVIWHGLGDSYDSDGVNFLGEFLNETIGPTYTYNIRLHEKPSADRSATFFGNLTEQIRSVCDEIAREPILRRAKGINAIGFSQGGQFMRAYVERCNAPPVANLVTFGSQHSGISEFENCEDNSWNPLVCAAWEGILRSQTWSDFVQSRVVPAQYFRDPEDQESYLAHSNFLADVNNERAVKNVTYKENIKKLKSFVMYMFSNDTTVVPKESAYFDDVVGKGNEANITKLKDRQLYTEDWLGLRDLDERARLHFRIAEGGHMQISEGLLKEVFETMYKNGR
ncbi:MAG: hypothetical protein Q9163_001216 [Psora crenata]